MDVCYGCKGCFLFKFYDIENLVKFSYKKKKIVEFTLGINFPNFFGWKNDKICSYWELGRGGEQ
jgi:hypothetical protein